MKRILLLGPNGQLGTDIQREAQGGEGAEFTVFPVGRQRLDVQALDSIRPLLEDHDFDVLVNCTSYHKTDEVEDNGSRAVTVNAHAVEAMAKVCAEKGTRFVHISTDYVFDGEKGSPYSEDDCPHPVNVYGVTKALGENLLRRTGADALILRVASLFGTAGASGKGGNFVETMIRLAREKGQLRVVDDIRMSPTGTRDIARAIHDLLKIEAPAGIYHVVNSGDATWYEFAREIVRLAGFEIPVIPVTSDEFPTRAKRAPLSVLDNSRIWDVRGRPMPHWSEALAEYMEKQHSV
jgi:dTDP-4-dehydrorhamnose reductase